MAFCTQCGAPLPENGKFCPNCGAHTEAELPAEVSAADAAPIELTAPVPAASDPQPLAMQVPESLPPEEKTSRKIGTLFTFASFVLAIMSLLSGSLFLSIVFSVAAIVCGVFAFVNKGRLKGFVIAAFLIAAFAFSDTVWYIATGEIYIESLLGSASASARAGTEISYDQTQRITEGGIIFDLPAGFQEETDNGVSFYSYGNDIVVYFTAIETDRVSSSITSSDLKQIVESGAKEALTDCTALSGKAAAIGSFDSWVGEYSGKSNGYAAYGKLAIINNSSKPSSTLVYCAVFSTEEEQAQGQKLFDKITASAIPIGGTATKSGDGTSAGTTSGSNSSSAASGSVSGVDPELARFLNSYESFVDEYVAFMKKYMSDPANVLSMLGDYLDMIEELEDFSDQADRYDTDNMSAADAKYYLEVMTRCEMKLLDVLS